MSSPKGTVHLFLLLFFYFSYSSDSSLTSSAILYQSWCNTPDVSIYYNGFAILAVLATSRDIQTSTKFLFGFLNNVSTTYARKEDSFYLVVALLPPGADDPRPVVVWCANRDKPVKENATLHFTAKRGLELEDVDGTLVWSTNTSGLSVTQINLSREGNLMLLDGKVNVIWQSFDYPTDTWLPNQNISSLQRLTSSNSSSNLASGLYSLTVGPNNNLVAFIHSDPPQSYVSHVLDGVYPFTFQGSLNIIRYSPDIASEGFSYIRLEPDGHLNVSTLPGRKNTMQSLDMFQYILGWSDCDYPAACGTYGVCSGNGLCKNCPGPNTTNYFTQSQHGQPKTGCRLVTPLSCEDRQLHTFLELKNVTYFNLEPLLSTTDIESCKRACLDNCSCKAAFFSSGQCSLKSQVYSLKHNVTYNSVAFIKIQKQALSLPNRKPDKKKSYLIPILASTLLVGLVIILVILASYYYKMPISPKNNNEEEEEDQLIRALNRFSFLELKSATRDFQVRLGRGGFGSVFDGDLADGTKVAVKCLDSVGQGRKEFLAEVNTIGSINHFNLVRLIGYCAEKSKRLLVYEHICNGSLDKWIFNRDRTQALGWEIRRKIITGLAKGLEYLHILCNPCIIHFDIKPQNILLDGDFNVKISDFGLAKLIDRDQSQVLTVLRGTPGYLAPELLKGTNISVKADVFSFGIVVLEIVFGRKNLDSSRSEPLIEIVKEKAEKDQLHDLVDGYNEEVQSNKEEVIKMIKIGIWCLQAHRTRPSISTVLKVLEGSMDLGSVAEFCFETMQPMGAHLQANSALSTNSTPPVASILSGPR